MAQRAFARKMDRLGTESAFEVLAKARALEKVKENLAAGRIHTEDPEELAEQMQSSQRVAWADNAIRLAVEMTVASIGRLDLSGSPDEQAMQVRDAIRVLFPEAVTLVREAREGLS